MDTSSEAVETRASGSPQNAPGDSSRSARIWGFVLILIGGGALAAQVWPDFDRYIPLVIGLGLLALFIISRSYGALIGGAIMTGIGGGMMAADLYPKSIGDGAGVTLGLGLGFISIWLIGLVLRLKEHHFWPLIPGGILVLVGTGLTLDAFNQDISKYVVPGIVLGIGILILIVGFARSSRDKGASV